RRGEEKEHRTAGRLVVAAGVRQAAPPRTRRGALRRRAAAARDRLASGERDEQDQHYDPAAWPFHAAILARDRVYIGSRFMPRAFARSSLADAVARLRPGMKVLLPPGSGEPRALVAEICHQSERLRDLTLLGRIHLRA